MVEAQSVQESRPTSRPSRRRRTVTRAVTGAAIVLGAIAVAAPSWAGPLSGC